jgi:predicted O-methyltransferase YrrM
MNLEDYVLDHIDEEGESLAALYRAAHVRLVRPRMVAGHWLGRVLKMLVRLHRPARVLEIGAYSGYSAICMAEGLPAGGIVETIEREEEMVDFIREQFARSGLGHRIRLHVGDALEVIPRLEGMFDMVFIDGDKRLYDAFYDRVYDRVRPGGVIVADNTLWGGKVLENPAPGDEQTLGIVRFNERIREDQRVEKVILPLRDGLTIVYKPETASNK